MRSVEVQAEQVLLNTTIKHFAIFRLNLIATFMLH